MSGHRLVPDRRGELFCGSYVNSEDMTTLQISHVIIWCWVALDTGLAALGIAVVRGSTILQIYWRCVEFTCQGFQSNFVVVFFEVGFSVVFPGPTTALMTYLTACCALNRLLRSWSWYCICVADVSSCTFLASHISKQNTLLKAESRQGEGRHGSNISLDSLGLSKGRC